MADFPSTKHLSTALSPLPRCRSTGDGKRNRARRAPCLRLASLQPSRELERRMRLVTICYTVSLDALLAHSFVLLKPLELNGYCTTWSGRAVAPPPAA